MREKRRNILGSASPPLHFCQTKCLTSAILQHMLDVNIMSPCLALTKKKKDWGKKKVAKMFWFLACPCGFLPALTFFSDFSETNVDCLRKVRMLCGFCRKCSKLVTFAGCSTGIRSPLQQLPGATTLTAPAGKPGAALQISF